MSVAVGLTTDCSKRTRVIGMGFSVATVLDEDREARPSFVTQMTGIGARTLSKAVEAGFIGKLTHRVTLAVAALPMLTSARTPDSMPIPVLRMGVKEPAIGTDGDHNPPRKWVGLGADMGDSEFADASLRWWTRPGRQRVTDAGYLLVAIGGLTVGLLRISGTKGPRVADDRIEYIGDLVARADDVVSRAIRIVDAAASQDERDFAQEVLATRSTTRGGGVINLLDADLDAGKA